jgi:hypothetical protein
MATHFRAIGVFIFISTYPHINQLPSISRMIVCTSNGHLDHILLSIFYPDEDELKSISSSQNASKIAHEIMQAKKRTKYSTLG